MPEPIPWTFVVRTSTRMPPLKVVGVALDDVELEDARGRSPDPGSGDVSGGWSSSSVCGEVPGGRPGLGLLLRAREPRARHVAVPARCRVARPRRAQQLVDVRVDDRLVAGHVQLLAMGLECDVAVEVRERHLVVDAVGVQAEARVEPVAQGAGRRVVDRVVDRAPGLGVDPVAGGAERAVPRSAVGLLVVLDDVRRPLGRVVLRAVDQLRRLADPVVLVEVVTAVRKQRVRERVRERHAVQVVTGGERAALLLHVAVEAWNARVSGSDPPL